MVDIMVIPYSTFKEKMRIMKSNKNIRFSDYGNCLMNEMYIGNDEPKAGKLVYEWRKNNG